MMTQGSGTDLPFDNPTSQEQRAATLREMHSVVSPEAGGRFAHRLIEHINTRGPTLEYPRLPSGSPWSGPQVGDEPPLGYSVEDLEPTGEPHEVAAGLPLPDSADLPPLGSADLAGSSPTSAPQLPDVAAVTARPFSNSAPPSIADHAPGKGGVTSRVELSKAGTITRRFG
jgi:hypothetical protein